MHSDVWTYRYATELGSNIASADISGFKIEALDGSIGKVDDATFEAGSSSSSSTRARGSSARRFCCLRVSFRSIDEEHEDPLRATERRTRSRTLLSSTSRYARRRFVSQSGSARTTGRAVRGTATGTTPSRSFRYLPEGRPVQPEASGTPQSSTSLLRSSEISTPGGTSNADSRR